MGPRKSTMGREEIEELINLLGWSQAQLARELDMSTAVISRWLTGERNPLGPARILMRQWLEEARRKAKQPA